MKRYLSILTYLITIIFATVIFAGDYLSTKVIQANWGSADGEFGLVLEAEGNCPQALTVAENRDLVILDPVNRRVQSYSANGKWIGKFAISSRAFDIQFEGDRIVLLAPYDYLIEAYNRDGKLIEKIPINRKIDLVDGLRISDHKIFVQTIKQMQYRVDVKSPTVQFQSVEQGISGRIPEFRFRTRWIDSHRGYLLIDDRNVSKTETITITTVDELGSLIFLNTDERGHIYLRKELFSADGKPYYEVDKLDRNGVVLNSIQIQNENIVAPYKPITIDKEGTIYFLEIKPEGFAVIRWQEQK